MRVFRLLDAAMLLVGSGAVVAGVAQVSPPAAWIVGGLALVALGVFPTRRS
jgi:hypothetical protein